MAYFANGTEAEMFEARWCARCVHSLPDDGCPVMAAHWLWNYDECNNDDSILHKMIPIEGVTNGVCFMFREDAGQKEKP